MYSTTIRLRLCHCYLRLIYSTVHVSKHQARPFLRGRPGPRYYLAGNYSNKRSTSYKRLGSTSAVYGIKCVDDALILLPVVKLLITATNYLLPEYFSNLKGPVVGNRNPPDLRYFNSTRSPVLNS